MWSHLSYVTKGNTAQYPENLPDQSYEYREKAYCAPAHGRLLHANGVHADANRGVQADISLASLREELEEQGLLVEMPRVEPEDFMAAYSYAQRGQKPGDIDSEPSLLAIRSRLVELCVLPLLLNPLVRTR